jgi:hypothetical protein
MLSYLQSIGNMFGTNLTVKAARRSFWRAKALQVLLVLSIFPVIRNVSVGSVLNCLLEATLTIWS